MTKTSEIDLNGNLVVTITQDDGVVIVRTVPKAVAQKQLEKRTIELAGELARHDAEIARLTILKTEAEAEVVAKTADLDLLSQ